MKNLTLLALILALLTTFVFAQERRPLGKIRQQRQENRGHGNQDGMKTYELSLDGVTRTYVIYRSAKVPVTQKTPVVFAFHGTGGNGPQFMQDSGWMEVADREGLTIVSGSSLRYHIYQDELYSKGEVIENSHQFAWKWNIFRLPTMLDPKYPNQTLYDDVKFVLAMTDKVKSNYAVDETRFYATGFSNGAQMTARLAVQLTNVFAAYGLCAIGNPVIPEDMVRTGEYTNEPFKPRPVMHILGEVDGKVNHAAGTSSFPVDESAVASGSFIKNRIIAAWGRLLNLNDQYEYKRTNKAATFRYRKPINGGSQELNFAIVQGMGHVYPNGGKFGFKVADWFWAFMKDYQR